MNSCDKGFHVHSNIWTPFVGEMLAFEQESGNPNYSYVVAIKKGSKEWDTCQESRPHMLIVTAA